MKKIVALSVFAGMTLTAGAAFAAEDVHAKFDQNAKEIKAAVEKVVAPEGHSAGSAAATENGVAVDCASDGVKANPECEAKAAAEVSKTTSKLGTVESKKFTASVKTGANAGKEAKAAKAAKKGKLAKTGTPAVVASMASLLAVVTGAGVVAYRKFA